MTLRDLPPVRALAEGDTQRCRGCGDVKPLSDFHRDANGPLGRRARCRQCMNATGRLYGAPLTRIATRTNQDGPIPPGCASPCWVWRGTHDRRGYGKMSFGGRMGRVHRIAFEIENGPVPDGMWVLHRCDNPACCNPAHLFLGTHNDNMRDMAAKGRRRGADPAPPSTDCHARQGATNGRALLSTDDVVTIRREYAAGATTHALSAGFGVSVSTVQSIVRGRTWRHVPVPALAVLA